MIFIMCECQLWQQMVLYAADFLFSFSDMVCLKLSFTVYTQGFRIHTKRLSGKENTLGSCSVLETVCLIHRFDKRVKYKLC